MTWWLATKVSFFVTCACFWLGGVILMILFAIAALKDEDPFATATFDFERRSKTTNRTIARTGHMIRTTQAGKIARALLKSGTLLLGVTVCLFIARLVFEGPLK